MGAILARVFGRMLGALSDGGPAVEFDPHDNRVAVQCCVSERPVSNSSGSSSVSETKVAPWSGSDPDPPTNLTAMPPVASQ